MVTSKQTAGRFFETIAESSTGTSYKNPQKFPIELLGERPAKLLEMFPVSIVEEFTALLLEFPEFFGNLL